MAASTTPPSKAKAEKAPKAEKVKKEPGEKKPRAARVDYGFTPISVIHIVPGEYKFRGMRLSWFEDLKKYDGKTVEQFSKGGKKPNEDPPRGWLRFFVVTAGAATLEAPAEKAA